MSHLGPVQQSSWACCRLLLSAKALQKGTNAHLLSFDSDLCDHVKGHTALDLENCLTHVR